MTVALELADVSQEFGGGSPWLDRLLHREGRVVKAVRSVSLAIEKGEVFGLVGESGCGKSTLGRIAAGLLRPTRGRVLVDGEPIRKQPGSRAGLEVQMIFQNPMASLNPRRRVRDIIGEAPLMHGLVRRAELRDHVEALLARVGLDAEFAERFPHQCSGGQRQRIGIARALAVKPKVLICDEPVTALDVSIQAHVLNLFMELRRDLGLTMLFVSHDLRVIRHVADRVGIMYLGEMVELGAAAAVLGEPAHPYTRGLLDSVPKLGRGRQRFHPVSGEIPSPFAPPPGCAYHPRCPSVMDICRRERPAVSIAPGGQRVACHLYRMPASSAAATAGPPLVTAV
jgi:peptide/nickel transport system ATP-binding protein